MKDLVVLVACSQIDHSMRGILARHLSLQIRPILFDIFVHDHKDPGCLHKSDEFLRAQSSRYAKSLVVFDYDGCGGQPRSAEDLERDVEANLAANGWGDRGGAVIISPELEAWVWSDSAAVDEVCGWSGRNPPLRTWIQNKGFAVDNFCKPIQPKEALQEALKEVRQQRSSALFRKLADRVSLDRCVDRAFGKLKRLLQGWFPPTRYS